MPKPKTDSDEMAILKRKLRELEWTTIILIIFLVVWFLGFIPISKVEQELEEVKETAEIVEGKIKIVEGVTEGLTKIDLEIFKTQAKILKTLGSRIDELERETVKESSFMFGECKYLAGSVNCDYRSYQ